MLLKAFLHTLTIFGLICWAGLLVIGLTGIGIDWYDVLTYGFNN